MKSTRVVATRVRGGRCEADWIGQRGEPRCSLEDRGCQGMVLTTVSDTCGRMKARRHSVADQTEPNAVQFGPSAGKSSDARFRSPTTKAPKPRKASAGEKSIHLWAASRPGHRQSHSLRQQSHPARFVAGGRNPLACIHTQREPVVPPAGTGTEYRRPQAVSWRLAVLHTKASGDRSRIGGSTSIRGTAANAIRGEMTFSPSRP